MKKAYRIFVVHIVLLFWIFSFQQIFSQQSSGKSNQQMKLFRTEKMAPVIDPHSAQREILLESGPITSSDQKVRLQMPDGTETKLAQDNETILKKMRVSPEQNIPYIVKVQGPSVAGTKKEIESHGGEILEYVKFYAFIVRMNTAVRNKVEKLKSVEWIGVYKPEHRLSKRLQERIKAVKEECKTTSSLNTKGRKHLIPQIKVVLKPNTLELKSPESSEDSSLCVVIYLYSKADISMVCKLIEQSGGTIEVRIANDRISKIRATLPVDKIESISTIPDIRIMYPYVKPNLHNDKAAEIIGAPPVWDTHGLTGAGQIVGHADTGLDVGKNDSTMSADFRGRIKASFALGRNGDWSDFSGHGTHTAGSILGNGANSGGQYKGIAYEAELVHQSIEDSKGDLEGIPADYGDLFQQAYDAGARIHSDSWGVNTNGTYDRSIELDAWMWNNGSPRDMLIVVSAGNEGPDAGTVGSPGTAKNAITVGASENFRPYCGFDADNPLEIADFSSRGPTFDGRIKPDIVAPGTWVVSAKTNGGHISFSDDMETGVAGWTEEPEVTPWQLRKNDYHTSFTCWQYAIGGGSTFDHFLVSPTFTPTFGCLYYYNLWFRGSFPSDYRLYFGIRPQALQSFNYWGFLQGNYLDKWSQINLPIPSIGLLFNSINIHEGTNLLGEGTLADINGDGKIDIVCVLIGGGDPWWGGVVWYENILPNTGTWIEHRLEEIPTVYVRNIAVGDIDGDNDIDIIISELSGSNPEPVKWWENPGNGINGWIPHIIDEDFATGDLKISDIDGDGDKDVIATEYKYGYFIPLVWWENIDGQGDSWSDPYIIYGSIGYTNYIYSDDMDGDGDMDILVFDRTQDTIRWYKNSTGDGLLWESKLIYKDANKDPLNGLLVDLDKDGDIDILASMNDKDGVTHPWHDDDEICWFENISGDWTNFQKHTISLIYRPNQCFTQDLDGDGDWDVITSSNDPSLLVWYENLGSADDWFEHPLSDLSGQSLVVGSFDANHDNLKDIVDICGGQKTLRLSLNTGQPQSYQVCINPYSAGGSSSSLIAKIDDVSVQTFTSWSDMWDLGLAKRGDHIDKLYTLMGGTSMSASLVAGAAAIVRQYLQDYEGFSPSAEIIKAILINGSTDISTNRPDMNYGWGLLNLENSLFPPSSSQRRFLYEDTQSINENTTDTFLFEVFDSTEDLRVTLVWCDPEGSSLQNNLNLTLVNPNNTVAYPLNAKINFIKNSIVNAHSSNCYDVVDLDKDGDFDIISAWWGNGVIWWENEGTDNGSGSAYNFIRHDIYTGGGNWGAVKAGDIDNDNDLDVVAGDWTNGDICWFKNDGTPSDGGWTKYTISYSFDYVRNLDLADLDLDGKLDVVATTSSGNKVSWWKNNVPQYPNWVENVLQTGFNGAYEVQCVDIDSDGDKDVLSGAYSDDVSWWENPYPLTTSWERHTLTGNSGAQTVISFDIDNDGDKDIIAGDSDMVNYWENVGDDIGPDSADAFIFHIIAKINSDGDHIDAGDVDGDGDYDILCSHGSICLINNGNAEFKTVAVNNINNTYSLLCDLDKDGDLDFLGGYAGSPGDNILFYENKGIQDMDNNVEMIHIQSPSIGLWSCNISGYTIPFGPQPYALVVSGAISPPPLPTPTPTPVMSIDFACLTPLTDVWVWEKPGEMSEENPSRWAWLGYKQDFTKGWQTLAGDFFNNDGLMEFACITQYGSVWACQNNGNRQFINNQWQSSGYICDKALGWYVFAGDFNGDERSDLVQLNGSYGEAWVGLNNGSNIPYPNYWGRPGFLYNPQNMYWIGVGDVNNDGRDDLVQLTPYGDAWVALSSGLSFGAPSRWGWLGFKHDPANAWGVHIGDFNGDGKADLCCVTPYTDAWVSLSTGSAFGAPSRWGWLGFRDNPTRGIGWNVFAGDVNGDGKDDLIQLTKHGDIWFAISTGSGFNAPYRAGWPGFCHQPEGPWQVFVGKFK